VKTGKGFYTYDARTAQGDPVEARDRKLLRLLKTLSS
jgi:hypothetical protein